MNEFKSKTTIIHKMMISIFDDSIELLAFAKSRIYTCHSNNTDEWWDSNLEGILCHIIDSYQKSKYLVMLDTATFEILFKHELYKNFDLNYLEITNYFHCFESNNSLIGFKFENENEAKNLILTIKKISDNVAKNLFSIFNRLKPEKEKEVNMNLKINKLKQKFQSKCENLNPQNHDYPSNIEIKYRKSFEILNEFKFDYTKKQFLVVHNSLYFRKIISELDLEDFDFKDKEKTANLRTEIIKMCGNDFSPQIISKKIDFMNLIITKDLQSMGLQGKAYRLTNSIQNMKHNTTSESEINKKFTPIIEFIKKYNSYYQTTKKNQSRPMHKKTFYKFPRIPDILEKNGDNGDVHDELVQDLKKYKMKTIINELDNGNNFEKNESNNFDYKFKNSQSLYMRRVNGKDDSVGGEENEWSD